MTAEQWARVQALFEAALSAAPEARAALLDAACADDPLVRGEVASLLAAHERSADFIEQPAFEVGAELLADPESPPLDGRVVGPYIIRQEIGRGGMGVVYLADDTRLARRVALKALASHVGQADDRRKRLRLEARAAAALSHPGIATVYACEEIDGELYLALEYVPGRTLRELIGAGPCSVSDVLDIATQLARALAAAHAYGLVHLDLKPENVVKTSAGVVKILDFGVARMETLASTRAGDGEGAGTPGYMAPEQIRGGPVDFRADLFALGVLVYELASGANPFEAATRRETLARTLAFEPVPLSTVCRVSAPALDRLVAACLEKSVEARPASTQQLLGELERLQADRARSGPLAHPSTALWWEVHQAVASGVYVLMMYPTWFVRAWFPSVWGTLFLLAALGCAAGATTRRLHLWFTARFYPAELAAERIRARVWTRRCDVGLAASWGLAAFAIASQHAEFAMLFLAAAVATATAAFIIEPTTARAAFDVDVGRSST